MDEPQHHHLVNRYRTDFEFQRLVNALIAAYSTGRLTNDDVADATTLARTELDRAKARVRSRPNVP